MDQHSENVYEAEGIQTETANSRSNTEKLVTLTSTPYSTPSATAKPELSAHTETIPDKVAISVLNAPSNDSLSTITTVVEGH